MKLKLKRVPVLDKARFAVSDSIILTDGKEVNITIQVRSTLAVSELMYAKAIADKITEALK